MSDFSVKIDEVIKAIRDRSHLVRTVITDKNGHRKTVYKKPMEADQVKHHSFRSEDEKLDAEYMAAVKNHDIEKLRQMVLDRAAKMGYSNCIPEQAEGYKLRVSAPPKKTKTIYKTFFVDTHGKPSALFIGNSENLPMNVWIDAKEAFHFTDPVNGRVYVPSMGNPQNKEAGKTGDTHYFPAEMKDELIKRGYITDRTKLKNTITKGKGDKKQTVQLNQEVGAITALAYRPGWHGGDLPFFPQGGTKIKGSNYDNVHRWNQVVFEIEIDADTDYTETARAEGEEKRKTDKYAEDDLQYMPENGFYQFTTNPTVKEQTGGKGDWFISHSIKIKRALTEEECNKILADNGMKPQEWESKDKEGTIGKMDLSSLGYTGPDFDAARKTLAPITYDDNGNVIPLSKRFNKDENDVRKSMFYHTWEGWV